jgi:hypothetical protein
VVALAITYRVNIPLNNELERAGPPDRIVDPAAFGCLRWALILHGRA